MKIMEVDWMKPSTQEEIEMMKKMMQLHRHPELSLPYTNTSEVPEIKFSGGTAAINQTTTTPIYHNPFVTSTTFTNPPSSTPFLSTPVQEPGTTPLSSTYFDTDSTIKPLSSQTTTNLKKIGTLFYTMSSNSDSVPNRNSMESMREMIFSMAAMQPIQIDPESVKPVKRRNVKISRDPQSVAARQRREKISEKIRILQRLVPGGTKMDTACMLDEAIHYVKFLKKQVQSLEQLGVNRSMGAAGFGLIQTRAILANRNYSSLVKGFPAYSSGGLYSNA